MEVGVLIETGGDRMGRDRVPGSVVSVARELVARELVGRSPGVSVCRVVLSGLAALVFVATGCSTPAPEGNGTPTPIPTQLRAPSPTAEDLVEAARSAALAAYAGMWRAYDQAGRAPAADPNDPRLAEFATGEALANLMTALGRLRDRGLVFEGTYELTSPEVVELSPADAPTSAKIEDCQDSSEWMVVRADGGDYEDEPGGRQAVFVDAVLDDDGTWRVSGFAVREVGTC